MKHLPTIIGVLIDRLTLGLTSFSNFSHHQTQRQVYVNTCMKILVYLFCTTSLMANKKLMIIPADGQSNMVGFGKIVNQGEEDKVLPNMFQLSQGWDKYYKAAKYGDVIPAKQPLQFRRNLPQNIHRNNVSLAFYFSKQMAKTYPDWDILIVPTAQGSTGYAENHWGIGDTLFKKSIERVTKAIEYGNTNYDQVIIPAWLYHQGEDDSGEKRLKQIERELTPALLERRKIFTKFGTFPILLGEVCHTSNRIAVNPILNKIPASVTSSSTISTKEYTAAQDKLHFTGTELRNIGNDYFQTWLEKYQAGFPQL